MKQVPPLWVNSYFFWKSSSFKQRAENQVHPYTWKCTIGIRSICSSTNKINISHYEYFSSFCRQGNTPAGSYRFSISLRQYNFSLYRAVPEREGERNETEKMRQKQKKTKKGRTAISATTANTMGHQCYKFQTLSFNQSLIGWLVEFGLTGLCYSISVYFKKSPKEEGKENKFDRLERKYQKNPYPRLPGAQ